MRPWKCCRGDGLRPCTGEGNRANVGWCDLPPFSSDFQQARLHDCQAVMADGARRGKECSFDLRFGSISCNYFTHNLTFLVCFVCLLSSDNYVSKL